MGGERRLGKGEKSEFHIAHKLPQGDSPYARAKYAQVVEKDLEAAVAWFRKSIKEGERVESALKDMAVAMKQLGRSDEAIQALHSFRGLCPKQAQHSIDNLLLDLYKKSGRMDDHINLIKQKLWTIYHGEAFNGNPTKTARSHGKKFQLTIQQETARLLGNMGWAYMQKRNFIAGEVIYKKSQLFDPDANKACNLGLCLIQQTRYVEAREILEEVVEGRIKGFNEDRPKQRAQDLIHELDSIDPLHMSHHDFTVGNGSYIKDAQNPIRELESQPSSPKMLMNYKSHHPCAANLTNSHDEGFEDSLYHLFNQRASARSRRLPIFEDISPLSPDHVT